MSWAPTEQLESDEVSRPLKTTLFGTGWRFPLMVSFVVAEDGVCTVVTADDVLFAATGSASLPLTVAVFVTVPAWEGAVTVMVNVAWVPGAVEPRLHVT